MGTAAVLAIEEGALISRLENAKQSSQTTSGELILDFSAVHRIDAAGLHALEDFARFARDKRLKVILRGIHVDLYKALKLIGVTDQFSFVD
jgi:anti-anti-sigma regulatory factor